MSSIQFDEFAGQKFQTFQRWLLSVCPYYPPHFLCLFSFWFRTGTFFAAFCCLAKSCFPMGLNTFSVAETPTDLPGIQFAEIAGNQYELIYVWITSGSCGSDLKLSHFVHRSYMECCTWGEPYHNWSMVFQNFPKCFKLSSFEMLRANHLIDAILPKANASWPCLLWWPNLKQNYVPSCMEFWPNLLIVCAGKDDFTSCVTCALRYSCVREW